MCYTITLSQLPPYEIKKFVSRLTKAIFKEAIVFQKKWKRNLPFAEYIVDRWEKASSLGFGESSSIYDSSVVIGNVQVGSNTWIGPFTVLDGSGGLIIGDHCSISAGVQIYSHHTVEWAISGGKVSPSKSPVKIGNRCYFGPNAIISKGVSIGHGCIIGANSLVRCDIPSGHKAYGSPARIKAIDGGNQPDININNCFSHQNNNQEFNNQFKQI